MDAGANNHAHVKKYKPALRRAWTSWLGLENSEPVKLNNRIKGLKMTNLVESEYQKYEQNLHKVIDLVESLDWVDTAPQQTAEGQEIDRIAKDLINLYDHVANRIPLREKPQKDGKLFNIHS